MPNYALPTLGTLVTEIKLEARLSGSTDNDPLVINTINELLLEYCFNNRYMEFLVLNFPIPTFDATGSYSLAVDFQHLSNVKYTDLNNGTITLHQRKTNLYLSNPSGSRPKYYEITGTIANYIINILPFNNVSAGETITVDYYALPPLLQDQANDVFPIARLYGPLKQKAIYRMIAYNTTNPQQAPTTASLKSDAMENEARAKPSG